MTTERVGVERRTEAGGPLGCLGNQCPPSPPQPPFRPQGDEESRAILDALQHALDETAALLAEVAREEEKRRRTTQEAA